MRIGQLAERLAASLGAAGPVPVAAYVALMVFYAVVPACEQVAAAPRDAGAVDVVPELSGELRLDNVTFRYAPDGPPVLRDVSIHARPGEFVALVGESGCGKSTLFRLALGLEQPLSGAVYYDGRDLGHLHRAALRRHVGMVVQDAALRTVLDNIIGLASDLSVDDAWRAARGRRPGHQGDADGHVHRHRRGRRRVPRRPSAAHHAHRRARAQSERAVPGRGHQLARQRHPGPDRPAGRGAVDHARRQRAPAVHDPRGGSDLRPAGRPGVQEGRFDELMLAEDVFRELVRRQMA